ncbi:MAG: ABC-F family ATP-binding cassette domain-containing protein [Clostridia bacterium]|nr:ABC-F family ATP-binding cassette domain-containing protein [Clostridia bacterium]
MAVLSVFNIKKSFGEEDIIENITFEVQKNDKIGLVGINGSGKTTLFKVLSGDYIPDDGTFTLGKDVNLGYMEQHVCRNDTISAFDEVETVFSKLMEMEEKLNRINHQLRKEGHATDELILESTALNDEFIALGGLTYKNRVRSTMIGLGFKEDELNLPVGVLSGGQKGKLQLAKMLLSGANLLLLDEPTNHLDITATEWLEDFLKSYNGSFIVISHDRYFLDAVTNRTFEMSNKHLTPYKGNYSNYLKLREEARLAQQRVYDATQKEIKRIEGIIEQQRRWNQERNYVTIAHKQKSIDRLEATLDKPEDEPDVIDFQFHASQRGGNDVLMVKDLALSFDEKHLFSNVSFDIHRREKIFLIGPNGCGKTSLLKVLLGINKQDEGSYKFGAHIDVGYYDQSQRSLDDSKRVIDEIWDLHPRMVESEVRGALAVFLFKGEDVFKPVSGLSGGERARILLLKLMLAETNFLILDEPTNHLDITSREALEDALKNYDGTLFVVSHDRYLINKLADKVLYLDESGVTEYLGNYDDYIAKREQQVAELPPEPKEERVNEYKLNKERRSEIRKMRTKLRNCEQEIENNELAVEEIEAQLADPEIATDYEKITELSLEHQRLKEEGEELFLKWEELSEWLAENDSED